MSVQLSYLFIHSTGEPYYVNKAFRKLDKQDVNKVKRRKSYKSVLYYPVGAVKEAKDEAVALKEWLTLGWEVRELCTEFKHEHSVF